MQRNTPCSAAWHPTLWPDRLDLPQAVSANSQPQAANSSGPPQTTADNSQPQAAGRGRRKGRSGRGGIKGRRGGEGGTRGSGGGRLVWRKKEEGRSGGEEPQAANSIRPPHATAHDSQPQAADSSGQPQAAARDSQPQAADSSGQPQAANNHSLPTRTITMGYGVTPRDPLVGPDLVRRRCVWMNVLEAKAVFKTWANVAIALHNQPWREIEDTFEGRTTYELQFWVVIGID